MKDYGRIYGVFWTSGDIQPLSDHSKLLAAYLLTCTHGTIAGAFYLPDAYVAEDLAWSPETVSEGFLELSDIGFVSRCEVTKWIWVRKFLQWNEPENPNQWKAVRKMAERVPPKCCWLPEFERSLNPSETVSEPPDNGSSTPRETVSKSVSVSVPVSVVTEAPAVPPQIPDPPRKSSARGKAQSQLVPLPEDFALTDRMREQALKRHADCDVDAWFELFRAHHTAHGKAMKSWEHAWVTWIGNGQKFGYPRRKEVSRASTNGLPVLNA